MTDATKIAKLRAKALSTMLPASDAGSLALCAPTSAAA